MAGQIPPQLKKAMGRRLDKALPSAGASNTNQSKVATFAEPGFQKSNLLRKANVGDIVGKGTSKPRTAPNTADNLDPAKLAIQRRLKRK